VKLTRGSARYGWTRLEKISDELGHCYFDLILICDFPFYVMHALPVKIERNKANMVCASTLDGPWEELDEHLCRDLAIGMRMRMDHR
jgi:hypothetical protein